MSRPLASAALQVTAADVTLLESIASACERHATNRGKRKDGAAWRGRATGLRRLAARVQRAVHDPESLED